MDGYYDVPKNEIRADLQHDYLNDYYHSNVSEVGIIDPWASGLMALILGICIGSFLNVVALRSLAKTAFIAQDIVESLSPEAVRVLGSKSWLSPWSQCINCHHRIGPLDNIPVVSYMMLNGKCRHCKEPIHWQYPVVEISTGIMFVAILHVFGWSIEGLAMLIFASTLIAVTITDFRDHLIPHEITYPSILFGILYSTVFRREPLETLAGIGIAYILFDFIQFYGLLFIQGISSDEEESAADDSVVKEPGSTESAAKATESSVSEIDLDEVQDPLIDRVFDIKDKPEDVQKPDDEQMTADDYVVMGGGDAVMAAVVAAWMGWDKMILAIMLAFLIGSVMGATYLFYDMKKRGVLHETIKPAVVGFLLGFGILCVPLVALNSLSPTASWFNPQLLAFASAGGLAGAALGATWSGSKFRKRFPFGPAIAVGAIIAMFVTHDPDWYGKLPGYLNW